VEVYEGTENTSGTRSAACLVLYPASNVSSLWVLWKIETRTTVRWTNILKHIGSYYTGAECNCSKIGGC
jgi:hypothetical protein